jgi:hypothetical protein
VTSATNVANVGAANAPPTTCNTSPRPAGTVNTGSIGESLHRGYKHADASAISGADHGNTPDHGQDQTIRTAKLQKHKSAE